MPILPIERVLKNSNTEKFRWLYTALLRRSIYTLGDTTMIITRHVDTVEIS